MGVALNPKAGCDHVSAYGSQSSSTDEDSGNLEDGFGATGSSGGAGAIEHDADEALWTDIEIEVNTPS